jgi:hypothetical protein
MAQGAASLFRFAPTCLHPQSKLGVASLVSCVNTLSAIQAALQQLVAQQVSAATDASGAQQVAALQQVLPNVKALLDQHREQNLAVQRQQLLSGELEAFGPTSPSVRARAVSESGPILACPKCESQKPLLAFMQKV